MIINIFAILGMLLTYNVTQAAAKFAKVQVITLKKQRISDLKLYPAQLISAEQTTIVAPIAGRIASLHAVLGHSVTTKSVLLKLAHTKTSQMLPRPVLAPFYGQISKVFVVDGEQVSAGASLVSIMNRYKLRIKIAVPIIEIRHLKVGATGTFWLPQDQQDQAPVRINGISPTANAASGTVEVEIKWNFKTIKEAASFIKRQGLRPGMLGRTTFELNPHEAILVPNNILSSSYTKGHRVNTVVDNKVVPVLIIVGAIKEKNTEVLSGLKAGDKVITSSSFYLSPGATVTIQE